jgi:hypothetical protein
VTTEAEVRRQALALPEAYEDTHNTRPSFRVEKRIFAMLWPEASAPRPFMVAKLGSDDQHNMLQAYPEAVVPWIHYPQHGWTRVWWASADEALTALILRLAWLHVAPKRLWGRLAP